MNFSNGIFYSAGDFFKERLCTKAFKLCLDAGCTCPVRDGTKGSCGCIFCSQRGSGEFAAPGSLSVTEQLFAAKKLVQKKSASDKFVAYFQNFTATYGNSEELIQKYEEAVNAEGVVALSVATRPDCLSDAILEYLACLSHKMLVMVELGFQTSKKTSVLYIRRAYENQVLNQAICRIKSKSKNIHVVTHIIYGLPGETEEDMLSSVRYAIKAGADGLKISLLYVLRGTDLEVDYNLAKFSCLTMEEYFALLSKTLPIIPQNIVIHRLTGDGAKADLVAPLWTAQKRHVYNSMLNFFRQHNIVQGSLIPRNL